MMKKIHAAESIRGLACMAVVFSHLSLSFSPDLHGFDQANIGLDTFAQWVHHSPFGFLFSGTAAVFIFFVLSGYVLSYAVMRDSERIAEKLRQMIWKRYPRLAIPVLLSCVLVWLIFNSVEVDSQRVYPWLQEYLQQQITLPQALYQGSIGAFFFAQSSVNWVLWTMQIELFGSFMVFSLLALRQYHVGLMLVLGTVLFGFVGWHWGEGLLLGLFCFCMGMLMYLYAQPCGKWTALLLLGLGLYLAGVHDNSLSYVWLVKLLQDKSYDYANLLAAILVVYAILLSPFLSRCFDQSALVRLGQYSFSIYLLHLPLLYLICIPLLNLLMAAQWPVFLAQGSAILLYLILLIVIAAVYSHYVDAFAIRSSQSIANKIEKNLQRMRD